MTRLPGKLALVLAFSSWGIQAADVTIVPRVGLDVNYTDNIDLTQNNTQSSWVGMIRPGVNIQAEGNNGNLTLDYQGTQTYILSDHDKDDYWNNLNLNSWLGIKDTGFRFIANANISQVPRNNGRGASSDLLAGEVVDRRILRGGFEYSNNKKGLYDLNWNVTYTDSASGDDIGDYDGIRSEVQFRNGRSFRQWFWDGRYSYEKRNSSVNSDDVDQQVFDIRAGYRLNRNTAVFVKYYDEDRSANVTSNRNFNSSEVGPGVRWYFTNTSFAEATYNFSLDSEVNGDYLGGRLVWVPSARTEFNAEYNKRFFGDNYAFFLRHKIKRLENSLRYSEQLQSFDRSFFRGEIIGIYACPTGDVTNISDCFVQQGDVFQPGQVSFVGFTKQNQLFEDQLSLDKILTWNTNYQLSRTTFGLTASKTKRENLNTDNNNERLDINSNVSHKVGRKTDLTLSYRWYRIQFDKDTPTEQTDYYRQYEISLTHELSSSIDAVLGARYTDKTSNVIGNNYDESRAFLQLTKLF